MSEKSQNTYSTLPVPPEKPPDEAIAGKQAHAVDDNSKQQQQRSYINSLRTHIPQPIPNLCSLTPIVSTSPPPSFNPSTDLFLPLSEEETQPLVTHWSSSLIIKVVGKSFSVDYLFSSLQRIWKCSDSMKLIALGKGFYNVSLQSSMERDTILSEGPWFINQFMILVQQWVPGFKPSEAVISKVPIWISLPELPIEFHRIEILRKIGDTIGTFLKADMSAIEQNRVRFAKILVLIELLHPIKDVVWVGSSKQKLDFSEIPLFCSKCNSIGHNICPRYTIQKTGEVKEKLGVKDNKQPENSNTVSAMDVDNNPKENQWQEVKSKKKKNK